MRLLSFTICLLAPLWGNKSTGPADAPVATLQGIDVSHYQKQIDWETVVQKHDLHFAFVKATEGSDFADSLFCRNWETLRDLGIRRGAYHYFRPYGCGYEQALHFLQTVELEPGDLAPVLDIERTDGIAPEIMIQEAQIWLHIVEKKLGVKPIIYTGLNFYETHLKGHFDHYPLWIARYNNEAPLLTTGKRWDFWQYSNEGCLEGVSKKVDLNVFPGTTAMLERLCWYPPATETLEARVVAP